MKDKKYLQIITDKSVWEKWSNLAKQNDMPLITYIKYLLHRELTK